ncbi:MAG: hypothetical protein EON88_27780 [Brevundimonas sp.]|nr:MAG: hypothetical protein EON88_27780 [Brevundimonas sp.]
MSTVSIPKTLGAALITAALCAPAALATASHPSKAPATAARKHASTHKKTKRHASPVRVDVLSPVTGDRAGVGSQGFGVSLRIHFNTPLAATGFTAPQLTGPMVHANAAPFPGAFSGGPDDRLPGLIVLLSTTQTTKADGSPTGFTGPGQNLANLFNTTAVADRTTKTTDITTDWIAGAPLFGRNALTTLTVAVAADKNKDGIYNDAPATITDLTADGRIDARDLRAFGVAAPARTVAFSIID